MLNKEIVKNRMIATFLIATYLIAIRPAQAQISHSKDSSEERMKWFSDAKLGIFIHWGIYSVQGVTESWPIFYERMTYEDYMSQLNGFTAAKYNPDAWAKLFRESGARYSVLTTKHHDGVALWDTKRNDLSVVRKTPAGRDLIGPYCEALRKEGLKVGLYFSHLDWHHPDYSHYAYAKWSYDIVEDTARWNRFISFQRGQIKELADQFKPDLFWFDGDWDYTQEQFKMKETRQLINNWLPNAIINSRIGSYGDYDTPEGVIPITKPTSNYWELCLTINDSWGYQGSDKNWKSPNQVIRIFVDCISMGGNLLLDVGPKEDGTIPQEQVNVLKELGRWTAKHGEAVYGTRSGIPKDYFYGPSALSKDSATLYLYLDSKPIGPVSVKGIKNEIVSARVLGFNNVQLETKVMMKVKASETPGIAYINLPEKYIDSQVTVIALQLDGPLKLKKPPGQ